jgi:hypothetical protein
VTHSRLFANSDCDCNEVREQSYRTMTEPDYHAVVQEIRQFALRTRSAARRQALQQLSSGAQPSGSTHAVTPRNEIGIESTRLDALSIYPRIPSVVIKEDAAFDRPASQNTSPDESRSTGEQTQADAQIRRAPWLFVAPPRTPGSHSRVYQAEKAANVAARKRILQLLGPENGTTADTIGNSHIPRPLRFHRAATVPTEENRGPGRYDITPKAEEAISQRGMFGYKANVVFGPPTCQPNGSKRAGKVCTPAIYTHQHKSVPKIPKRLQWSADAVAAPREILLSEIAVAFHVQADQAEHTITDTESDSSEDSFWSAGEICEVNRQSSKENTIASSARMSVAEASSRASPVSHMIEFDSHAELSARSEWCNAQHQWFALLGRERHIRNSSKREPPITSKRPVRDIVWAAPTHRARGRSPLQALRNRKHRTAYDTVQNLLAKAGASMTQLVKLADEAMAGAEWHQAPPRRRRSSTDVSASSYYKGRQVASWKVEQALESFRLETLKRTGRRKRGNLRWYASQLHAEYIDGGTRLRSQSAPAYQRAASESSPQLLQIGGSSVLMSAQLGRDDVAEEDDHDGLRYNSHTAKDYIQRRHQRTPTFANMAGRPDDAEPGSADYSLSLQPAHDYILPSVPSAMFNRADRFIHDEATKDDEMLQLNTYAAEEYLRSKRLLAVPDFARATARDGDSQGTHKDVMTLDIYPNQGLHAVQPRASRYLHVDYERDIARSYSEISDALYETGPVLALEPADDHVRRHAAGPMLFSNAERWEDGKEDDELLIELLCDDSGNFRAPNAAATSMLLRRDQQQEPTASASHIQSSIIGRMTGRESEESFDMSDAIRHLGL